MFPLDRMLDIKLLINDKQKNRTANLFGFIAYSDRNPYIVKILNDDVFWQSLNERSRGWIIYAIKPRSEYYSGGNAKYVNDSLGLQEKDYPQFVVLGIGSNRTMKQQNYPIVGDSVETVYNSIEKIVDTVSSSLERILPANINSTAAHREAVKAVDAELASKRWKKVAGSLAELMMKFFIQLC